MPPFSMYSHSLGVSDATFTLKRLLAAALVAVTVASRLPS
jgi:hypothetical protein